MLPVTYVICNNQKGGVVPGSSESDYLPLKPVWLHLLLAMTSGHRHGYAMKKEVERRSGGRIKIWPPTLYRALTGLMDAGLVEDDPADHASDGDRQRRLYRITPLGRRVLAAEMHRLEDLVQEARVLDIISDRTGA
jgi:DNA-binding PadR family transcriptional regulator